MRFDADAGELVFEAVAGEGAGTLVGCRIPATTGLAGWSLAAEEPIAIDDVRADPRFDREFAEQTGYVPARLAVHPLLYGERSLGVLNVLDAGTRFGLAEMELLGRFAGHAAIALAAVDAARRASAAGPEPPLARLGQALEALESPAREAADALISALERLLDAAAP
jgi:GAF domain-containing protein